MVHPDKKEIKERWKEICTSEQAACRKDIASPAKGYRDAERIGTFDIRRDWEGWDCSAWRTEDSEQGNLINVYKYLKGGCKKTKPGSSHSYFVTGQNQFAQFEIQEIHWASTQIQEKSFFTVSVVNAGTSLSERLMRLSERFKTWPTVLCILLEPMMLWEGGWFIWSTLSALEMLVKTSVLEQLHLWEQLAAVHSCCSSLATNLMESFGGKFFFKGHYKQMCPCTQKCSGWISHV